ncbi:12-oxophytodienoate reductase [Pseudonocardiaceae bacterium YIM PH 21723]|nr:12-oxophytodienoate reductase [Pseudonocardiaceae bacterium YIM PH 21723]
MTSRIQQVLDRPFSIGRLTVPNRIAMAPMTRRFSPDGIPGEDVAAYYERRAQGQVGLIITEGTYVDRDAASAYSRVPHFHGDEALAGWAKVVERVHAAGGKIIPQLWHTGPARTETDPQADTPSGLNLDGEKIGEPMTQQDIDAIIAAFAQAAANAERLGFDGAELHGAHGYLLDSFLWDGTNQRADGYGGSLQARARFVIELVKAVRAEVSADFPIVLRFSQWKSGHYDAKLAPTPGELEQLLTPLADAGVDAFHASTRRYWLPEFDGSDLNLAGWVKKITGKPAISVGSVGLDQEFAGRAAPMGGPAQTTGVEQLLDRLERDEFDIIAVGRALLSNPDWAAKAIADKLDETVAFDKSVLGTLY